MKQLWNQLRGVAKDTWKQTQEAQLMLISSSLAYTTILSIVPFLAVSFSIFQMFKGLDNLYAIIKPIILQNLAESAGESAMNYLQQSIGNIHAGAIGITGFVSLLFTSMSMLSNIEKAINRIWKSQIKRQLFNRIATYWFFITLGPLSIAAVIGFLSSSGIGISKAIPSGISGIFLTALLLFAIYKWVPTRKVHNRPALVAAAFTSVLFHVAQWSYAFYIRHFVSYDKIYGSLGAIPILILWIYLVWVIILTGAALSATLQNRLEL